MKAHPSRLTPWPRALALAAACSACNGQTTFHRAEPLPAGRTEFVAAIDVVGALDSDAASPEGAAEARWRVGIGHDIDIGLGTSGMLSNDLYSFQADINWAFARGESLVWSLDPTVATLSAFDASATLVWLPLLVDVYTGERTSVTLAVKAGHIFLSGLPDSDLVTIAESGTLLSLGVGVRVHVAGNFSLHPELSLFLPVGHDLDANPLYVLGLGFVWN